MTGEREEVIRDHARPLQHHRFRYLLDPTLFLSNTTDAPGSPLSKAYMDREIRQMLAEAGFGAIRMQKRFLNVRTYPGGAALSRTRLLGRLERTIGWHLYAEARKPG